MAGAAQPHLAWQAEALWRQLSPALPGLSVEVLAHAASTNTTLLERARAAAGRRSGDTQPCLLVAEHQTHGRGRLGRDWHAAPGASLTFSLALPLAPLSWSGLSLAVGVAVADALEPLAGEPAGAPRIGLKWPNDLWRWDGPGRGRKLGGILVETVSVGPARMAVVGIGLNLTPPPAADPAAVAGLAELVPGLTAPQALAMIAAPLVAALQRFEAQGLAPFVGAYARRDLLAGQAVHTLGVTPAISGHADGIDTDGALRVITPAGPQRLVSGEVSVRLGQGDAPAC